MRVEEADLPRCRLEHFLNVSIHTILFSVCDMLLVISNSYCVKLHDVIARVWNTEKMWEYSEFL